MRDYSVITPAFWIGETGKKLRGDANAQLLAMYLMTSPHSTMTGVFHCPILYMAHETGMSIEGATKALARLFEAGFCEYEESSETVFVVRMASFQIAKVLKPNDNRIIGLKKEVEKMTSAFMKSRFLAIYSEVFCLTSEAVNPKPAIAPPKPLRSQEQDQEQDQDKKEPKGSTSPAKLPTCQTQDVIDLFHEILPELPAVRLLNDPRKKAISAFWKFVLTSQRSDGTVRATDADSALLWVRSYFERARNNDFLMGRNKKAGEHENWECDIDFLMGEKGKKQVIEKTKETA